MKTIHNFSSTIKNGSEKRQLSLQQHRYQLIHLTCLIIKSTPLSPHTLQGQIAQLPEPSAPSNQVQQKLIKPIHNAHTYNSDQLCM